MTRRLNVAGDIIAANDVQNDIGPTCLTQNAHKILIIKVNRSVRTE